MKPYFWLGREADFLESYEHLPEETLSFIPDNVVDPTQDELG